MKKKTRPKEYCYNCDEAHRNWVCTSDGVIQCWTCNNSWIDDSWTVQMCDSHSEPGNNDDDDLKDITKTLRRNRYAQHRESGLDSI